KMRQSLLDLQSLIKPGERKSQPVDTPAAETEALFPPDPGWPVKEVQESPVPVQEPLSDPPAGDNPLIDSSNQGRLEENRLYLELAAEIPDSADRLSYIQSLRDLQAESPTTKIAAAQSLAKWPVPTTENSLISAWKIEKDSKVRMEIIELLKIQNSGKILIAFQEFLQRPDPRSQLAALEGFNRYGSDEGMRSIVKALRSEHQMVRRRAVTYIGWSMHRKALPELVKLLRDPSAYVRKTTVMVVASFGDPSSVLFLLDALDDQDRSIRTLVYKTLKNMSGKDFGYDPGADHHQRLEAIIAWKRWWRANERTLKLRPLEPAAEPPDREVAAARKEKQEEAGPETGKVPRSPAGEKKTVVKTAPQIRPPRSPKPAAAQAAAAGKKAADAGALPNGSLEQKMYEILLKKPTKGMTIQDIGSSLNLPWQKLIQKTGLLQKTGWIYKDQNHHLFFPVLK
ncbi:MAG: HEAT repeat domain-containing protein, partial [bacterium]